MAGRSEAVPVTYVDIDSPYARISEGFFGGYIGLFDIVNPGNREVTIPGHGTFKEKGGFTTGTELFSATASFYLKDDGDTESEKVNVFIGLFDGEWFRQISGSEIVEVQFGANSFSLQLLQTFGAIEYVVKSAKGDFYLKHAMLEVTTVGSPTSPGPVASVPDGGATLVLMGLGLIGLVAVQTRLSRQAA